tara:strand:+ start:221 stop:472 length:252 start_codon:yes stop_codon:yes gene_type:complete
MVTLEEIKSDTEGTYEGLLLADGFDDAFIGAGQQFNNFVGVYDKDKCLSILKDQGMSHEEAFEYFDFNVTGSYVGPQTPIFIL